MRQRLIDRDPTRRIKCQHLFDQVNRVFICRPKQFIEVFATRARQLSHEGAIVIVLNLVDERCVRFSNQIGNHHHLLLFSLRG